MNTNIKIALGVVAGVNIGMYMRPWLPRFSRMLDSKTDAMYLDRRQRETGETFDES